MTRSIAVLGTGAIGSSVGADLTVAGHDVMLIDQWPAHVEAMKAHGLRVVMPDQEFNAAVTAHHLCDVCTLDREFDFVLLTAKSCDTRWMAEFMCSTDGIVEKLLRTSRSFREAADEIRYPARQARQLPAFI